MGGNEKIFYRNCSSHLTTHISRFIKLKQTVDSCFFSILCKVLKLVLFNFTAAKPVLKISQVGKKQLKTAVQFQAMRTSKVKSFKSNFMAIGWHVSALFVINSLLTGLDCKQLRHYCTRAYYKEYAFSKEILTG